MHYREQAVFGFRLHAQRWAHVARLLHDEALELTDRVTGALLLLYGQQLSRITTMTTEQVRRRDDQVFLRLSRDEITISEPLATLLITFTHDSRRHTGVGSPAAVLADLLHLHPTTAVRWVHRDAGGDWNRYAQLAQTPNHPP